MKTLRDNGWGMYLKSEPLCKVPIKEGSSMYKISDISDAEIIQAIDCCEPELD